MRRVKRVTVPDSDRTVFGGDNATASGTDSLQIQVTSVCYRDERKEMGSSACCSPRPEIP